VQVQAVELTDAETARVLPSESLVAELSSERAHCRCSSSTINFPKQQPSSLFSHQQHSTDVWNKITSLPTPHTTFNLLYNPQSHLSPLR